MVVSFSRLGNYGRLGNQLFQIAATLGIAERNNATAVFPAWKYEQYFEDPLPHGQCAVHVGKEYQFEYSEVDIIQDTDLVGYFQSYKYFPKNYKPKFAANIVNHWQQHEAFKKETIGIHIRRGDYVGHALYYQLPITWYISALLSQDYKNKNVIIISDDLDYCRVHFECLPNAHFIKCSEIDHMCILSLCDTVIMGNSSFAWWGAYLGKDKKVIHSGKMFRGDWADKNISDYYLPDWELHKEDKLDLSDVTFTIPVMHDHPDRKRNFDLSLCVLQNNFKTNVIVGECMTDMFAYSEQWATYRKYPYTEFHRTKMLNEMAKESTEIVVNWDCDIFIPPLQIWLAVELLREGIDCVYPYDGRFARMERQSWFRRVESTLDIGVVGNARLFKRDVKESVGGAVMWRKQAFEDFGMENEYMISYAPEDVERWERMHKLGVNVKRVDGTLYHMDHYRGSTSSKLNNPHFAESRRLLDTYRAMTADELRHEVDSWPWRHKYTEAYYNRINEGAVRSAEIVMDFLARFGYLSINFDGTPDYNIIDIGCGIGEWRLNNPEYIGVDYRSPVKESWYIDCNLEKSFPKFERKFNLCLCLEVAEHISEERADDLVKFLCSLSDTVLFSAAIPNQGGTGHVNEQWQTYWAEKFKANGFGAAKCYPVRDNKEVEFWYRQNMILYQRSSKGEVYNFVLPEYYEQITNGFKNR